MGLCAARAVPEPQERHVHECLFPMYVVKASWKRRASHRVRGEVSDFLEMDLPEPHHVLLRKGLLYTWRPGMSVIFVSHQWLGHSHPDPYGQHAAVLRGTLRGILDGRLASFSSPRPSPRASSEARRSSTDEKRFLGTDLLLQCHHMRCK